MGWQGLSLSLRSQAEAAADTRPYTGVAAAPALEAGGGGGVELHLGLGVTGKRELQNQRGNIFVKVIILSLAFHRGVQFTLLSEYERWSIKQVFKRHLFIILNWHDL